MPDAGHPIAILANQAPPRTRAAGYPGGGTPHHLENRTDTDVWVLEIGDRGPTDPVSYPNDDLAAVMGPDGQWRYTRKDGSPL